MTSIANGQPPAKRKRADDPSEETAASAIPVRSSVWYDDGNIVLQAEGTKWKVYRGILAQSSSIFQDMFSLPQPLSMDTAQVEGCPVVQLSDSAEEVEYVLQAICQREYVCFEKQLPLPVISAFIRLGTKYDIPKLRIEGQQRVFREFPTDLDYAETNADAFCWEFMTKPEDWFEVVLFARTTGLLSILPFALFVCCQIYTTSQIMGGAIREDGTVVCLSVQDQLACLAGFRAMCKAQAETTFSWAYTPNRPADCTSKMCLRFRQGWVNVNFTSSPIIIGLDTFDSLGLNPGDLCSACVAQAEEMHKAGREEFWALLPSLFGLPPWDELNKEREIE